MPELHLAQQIGIKRVGENEFVSIVPPAHLGNVRPIGYGGNTIALAIHAAQRTVDSSRTIYSVLGHFLGPSQVDRVIFCRVSRIRDTRSFTTRQVTLHQVLDDGSLRVCLALTADFHVDDQKETSFSPPWFTNYGPPEQYPTPDELHKTLVADGKLKEKIWRIYSPVMGYQSTLFEQRLCTEGISGQNLSGMAKELTTTLDHLDRTKKVSAEWIRARQTLSSWSEQMAALGFLLDDGLAIIPLAHDHRFMDEMVLGSSLDFALRIFSSDIDLNRWNLRERKTTAANAGRTYSESKLFDEHGNLLAEMSQVCILRTNRVEPQTKL